MSPAEEKLLLGLRRRKVRSEERLFLAEGERVARELLASAVRPRLAVVTSTFEDTPSGRELARDLKARCPVRRVDDGVLRALAATETPQGVLIAAEIPDYSLAKLGLHARSTILVLDAVQDPGNLGTLVRTAAALGAEAVVALPGTVDPWNPKAVRAAAGASFHLPVVQAEFENFVSWLDLSGFSLYAADAAGEPAETCDFAARGALVVGNEGAGLTPAIRSKAVTLVAVPIRGPAESLNVAVAAGILLYLMTRRH